MPPTRVHFYQESNGAVPFFDWLEKIPGVARAKALAYLARLEVSGHELRRPIADYLRDGIYELRPVASGVQYRVLYFFHGRDAVVVSHGIVKQDKVPAGEIDRAIRRREWFRSDPVRHSFKPEGGG